MYLRSEARRSSLSVAWRDVVRRRPVVIECSRDADDLGQEMRTREEVEAAAHDCLKPAAADLCPASIVANLTVVSRSDRGKLDSGLFDAAFGGGCAEYNGHDV